MICVGAMLGDSTSSIESNKEGFPIFKGGTLFKDPVVNMLVSDKRFGSLIGFLLMSLWTALNLLITTLVFFSAIWPSGVCYYVRKTFILFHFFVDFPRGLEVDQQ